MATLHYMATAKDSRLLELPEEAQELGIEPGDIVSISVKQPEKPDTVASNEKAPAVLREIVRRQEGRRHTDGPQTEQYFEKDAKERCTVRSQVARFDKIRYNAVALSVAA